MDRQAPADPICRPKTMWLLGPTSGGKTTLARASFNLLRRRGIAVLHFDGDEVREWFGPNHDFSGPARLRVVNTLIELTNKANASGIPVLVSALTAHADARRQIAARIENLSTVYVKCSIEECARRDPKGLYARARSGEIDTLIGYNSPYDAPQNPDLTLDTESISIQEGADIIARKLCDTGV